VTTKIVTKIVHLKCTYSRNTKNICIISKFSEKKKLKKNVDYFLRVNWHILIYSALTLFEKSNCIDWINFCYIQSLTKI